MKKILILLLISTLVFACTDNDEDTLKEPAKSTFKSHNIKTDGKQYFTFVSNLGNTVEPAIWDIAFGATPLTVETAPCQFFTMPNDPVIFTGADISIAAVEAESLDDVTSIPSESAFKLDVAEGDPIIGKNWVDGSFEIIPDTYIIKTCGGSLGVLQFTNYSYNPTLHQIYDVQFEYKFNNGGSTDFTSGNLNSITVPDANTGIQYFSLENGIVTSHDSFDLKFDGYSIWLGPNVTVSKLANIDIEDVTTVSDSGLEADELPSFVTTGWYDYGAGHVLTPRNYIYVVNTPDGKYPTFEITNYYDDQGNSGTYTINWKYLNE